MSFLALGAFAIVLASGAAGTSVGGYGPPATPGPCSYGYGYGYYGYGYPGYGYGGYGYGAPPPPAPMPVSIVYKGYRYTMYDNYAVMRKTWQGAEDYCTSMGEELVPHQDQDGFDAVNMLCADVDFTCWFGGKAPTDVLCPLISAEGGLLQQGCQQVVRFVCRKPDNSPSLPGLPSDATPMVISVQYKGYDYKLFDVNAVMMKNWQDANDYCLSLDHTLVPYEDADGFAAVTLLCSENDFTCWLGGKAPTDAFCPLISAEGGLLEQGCGQSVRFVCRQPL